MKVRHAFVPFVLLLAAGNAPAQASGPRGDPQGNPQLVSCTVIVQGALGDLVLNSDLVNAITNEPECMAAVRRAVPSLAAISGAYATLPAAHLAGAYQLLLQADVVQPTALSPEQRAQVIDTVVAHLRTRIDRMLVDEPRTLLRARSDELQRRHRELQVQQAELRARVDAATANRDGCKRIHDEMQAQFAAAQLELAVEERTREQIERLRTQYMAARDDARALFDKVAVQRDELQSRATTLNSAMVGTTSSAPTDKSEADKRRAELAAISAALRELAPALDNPTERIHDAQRMLTVVLEQVPTNALAVQRARARVDVLAEQTARAAKQLAEAEALRRESAALTAEAEQTGIELAVTKTLLLEIEGKLARLQAPQYTVLRQ